MRLSLPALAALAALVGNVHAIQRVTRTGRFLYQEDGTRFFIKGIGYQPQGEVLEADDNHFNEPGTFIDPLADAEGCARDLPNLQAANVNTVRVYSVDSSLNHDECMRLLSEADIHVILDLSLPVIASIDRTVPSWSTNIMNTYLATIEVFDKYDNILAYNIGNEVLDNIETSIPALPYLKAATRDIKAYLRSIGSERLVGYASIDGDLTFRKAVADFLSCGSDDTAIDIYGLNEYSWCGAGGSLETSRYTSNIEQFTDYNVVTYFSEYGCVSGGARPWTEVDVLLGEEMGAVWSGGIAFSYFPAQANDGKFGMVTISADNSTATPSADLEALGERYGANTGPALPAQADAEATVYPACVAVTGASLTLPGTPNNEACNCLFESLSCRVASAVADDLDIVGPLIGTACDLLDGEGLDCDSGIGGNGATGVYARISGCDPATKLSYVFSQYYESQDRLASACDFSGNATVNAAASAADTAEAQGESCIASPSATSVPGGGSRPSAQPSSPVPSAGTPSGGNGGSPSAAPANPSQTGRGNGAGGAREGLAAVGVLLAGVAGTFGALLVL
ncbi:1,3-beta-glucanosyltransferase [Coprinopsis marcescibilis]|uniref:1,3-beta-glucanosyltransferase n=1 Tax=Coprinopsis marcescibilis TaxID=230819 RepID=A0A5C3KYX1_COPMA|nr:1,3-beta-glucanosyltransferase [Coprinopsis marcescibilis]